MKLEMARAWNDAVALLRANQHVVLIVAGVFFFLPYLALVLFMPQVAEVETAATAEADPAAAFETLRAVYSQVWWQILLVTLVMAVGMLGLMALLTDRSRPTVGEALKTGVVCLLPYLGAQILMGLLFVVLVALCLIVAGAAGAGAGALAAIVLAVGAIYLFTKLSLTVPVIVIERVMNPVRALGRSWTLTKGNSLRLFLFYLLMVVALIVITVVLGLVTGVVGMVAGEETTFFIAGLINAATNMVAMTVYLAVLAAVHRQLSGAAPQAQNQTFG